MKNLWPEGFEAKNIRPANQILEEQAALLPKLTGDMVLAEVYKMSSAMAMMEDHENDFSYSFYLKGKFLKKYAFKVFMFSHDITLYPLKVTLDEVLANELHLNEEIVVNSEEQFESFIEQVLTSERLTDIIGSIIRISA